MINNKLRVPIQLLGQSGVKLTFPNCTVYFDPYLSDSVRELDSPDLNRLIPIPFPPDQVVDADVVLISHSHIDHCDPHTIPALADASPSARFICPQPVKSQLTEWKVGAGRVAVAEERWMPLAEGVDIKAVPAAHPEIIRDEHDRLESVGYLLKFNDEIIYLAGDTSVKQEIIDALKKEAPIHTAFLPINERNFFRERRGIIGNMSVRESLLFAAEVGVRQLVPVHWDMFEVNSVELDELRAVYKRIKPEFTILYSPTSLSLSPVKVSYIIRTLNEAQHLESLLEGIKSQNIAKSEYEVVIVDSGSVDGTLDIAVAHECHILHISKHDFSFGRSLNLGCEAASGDLLVITSGHCIPANSQWMERLCKPLQDGVAEYAYGRQLGVDGSSFSECQIFSKYYPVSEEYPREEFFCNNANSALLRGVWEEYRFDESITGLEDMELALRLVGNGGSVCYVPTAEVYHCHSESWQQVRRRFEREAIALKRIMPQIHVSLFDTVRYVLTSIVNDFRQAIRDRVFLKKSYEIICYRWNQYIGSYLGNREHRELSNEEKEKYFYPNLDRWL